MKLTQDVRTETERQEGMALKAAEFKAGGGAIYS